MIRRLLAMWSKDPAPFQPFDPEKAARFNAALYRKKAK